MGQQPRVPAHRRLVVWQRAADLAVNCYPLAARLPRNEQFDLARQMRRSSVGVSLNIAEGCGRGTRPDFRRFLSIARGSAMETDTQLVLAVRLGMLSADDTRLTEACALEVITMLSAMMRRDQP